MNNKYLDVILILKTQKATKFKTGFTGLIKFELVLIVYQVHLHVYFSMDNPYSIIYPDSQGA